MLSYRALLVQGVRVRDSSPLLVETFISDLGAPAPVRTRVSANIENIGGSEA